MFNTDEEIIHAGDVHNWLSEQYLIYQNNKKEQQAILKHVSIKLLQHDTVA
jgi:hypothetical protein